MLCKDEGNVFGDVPSAASSGMSTFESVVDLLTTLFPVWVCI